MKDSSFQYGSHFHYVSLILVYFTNALNGPVVTDERGKRFGQDMQVNKRGPIRNVSVKMHTKR